MAKDDGTEKGKPGNEAARPELEVTPDTRVRLSVGQFWGGLVAICVALVGGSVFITNFVSQKLASKEDLNASLATSKKDILEALATKTEVAVLATELKNIGEALKDLKGTQGKMFDAVIEIDKRLAVAEKK